MLRMNQRNDGLIAVLDDADMVVAIMTMEAFEELKNDPLRCALLEAKCSMKETP